jgi:hypothetical protein
LVVISDLNVSIRQCLSCLITLTLCTSVHYFFLTSQTNIWECSTKNKPLQAANSPVLSSNQINELGKWCTEYQEVGNINMLLHVEKNVCGQWSWIHDGSHGFFYRPKIIDISEISHISVGSDKIRYLLNFSYFTQTTQIQTHNNLVLIMFYS